MQINRRRTPLVLMELIVTILFFAVVSALCIQIFLKSYQIRENTSEYNNAVKMCSSIAEIVTHDNGSFNELSKIYPEGLKDGDTFTIETANGGRIVTTVTKEGKTTDITVVCKNDIKGEDVFRIDTACYIGGAGNE